MFIIAEHLKYMTWYVTSKGTIVSSKDYAARFRTKSEAQSFIDDYCKRDGNYEILKY